MGEISFNYLVILICLIANYTWLKDFDRFDDSWFFRFRCRVEEQAAGYSPKFGNTWRLSLESCTEYLRQERGMSDDLAHYSCPDNAI